MVVKNTGFIEVYIKNDLFKPLQFDFNFSIIPPISQSFVKSDAVCFTVSVPIPQVGPVNKVIWTL